LLRGESGTGKELIARAIYRHSPRRHTPFLTLNCTAFPEGLLESELFGHERGAFTGAHARKQGLFELADGGTLLLDEIGDMSLTTQAKLLRVLETKEFLRLGGTRPVTVDLGIIAATNADLEEAVQRRAFRLDLYHRLCVVMIEVPPLRQRLEDIPLLVQAFFEEFRRRHRKAVTGLGRGHAPVAPLSLAGERAGAAQLHRELGAPDRQAHDRGGRPTPILTCPPGC
jgi:transcriptional regulator with GAF, ATPase, and Fis domain